MRYKSFKIYLAVLAFLILLNTYGRNLVQNTGPAEPYPAGDGLLDPYAQARALGKGVNFGNLLDAAPQEGAWTGGMVILEPHFDLAAKAKAGLDSVRIPIRFSDHALANPPYTMPPGNP